MKDQENVLETANIAWKTKREKVEDIQKEKPQLTFGYRSIMESIDEIVLLLCNKHHVSGYIQLGALRKEISLSKQFNEE